MSTDISQLSKQKSKKLSLKKQRKVIQLLNNLFAGGFTLSEAVIFLKRSQLLSDNYTHRMQDSLVNGLSLSDMMANLGFSDNVVTQVALADVHGNTSRCLKKIEVYLLNMARVKGKLVEVATYPVLLLSFLVLIVLGLKNYLLPQLGQGNWATQVISDFPTIFLSSIALLTSIVLGFMIYSKRVTSLKFASHLSCFPLVGKSVQLYLTAYYAREWGNLIGQGVELTQIVQLMQKQRSRLFQEIGKDMEEGLLSGYSFDQKVLDYPFFLRELSLIIEYGEVKSKLGNELDIYAEETWELFFSRLNRATQLIQPIVFIMVALVIVMLYAAMLLPIYQNMEGTL